jgi:GT2 family glycosyltransferase
VSTVQKRLDLSGGALGVGVVCVLHGGFSVPSWLRLRDDLDLTLNDPLHHAYADLPPRAAVTRNERVRGFAENVNAALRRLFTEGRRDVACVVNFDVDAFPDPIPMLVEALAGDPQLAAVGALLYGRDRQPTFSVGVRPTPAREFLRAAGLRDRRPRRCLARCR